MNQVCRVSKKSIFWIKQIAGHLQHPGTIWIDPHSGDMYSPGAKLDDKEHHVSDRAKHAQRLDGKEVARIERLPVAPNELLPGPLVLSFRRWLDTSPRVGYAPRWSRHIGIGSRVDVTLLLHQRHRAARPWFRIETFRLFAVLTSEIPGKDLVGPVRH